MPPDVIASRPSSWKKPVLFFIIALVILAVAAAGVWWLISRPVSGPLGTAADSFNAGDLSGALTQVDQVLAENPGNVDALIAKSLALSQKGSLEFKETEYGPQAAAIAAQAIRLAPQNSEAYRALGYADEIQQKYADAHQAYEKAVSLDPKNALALFGDGHVYDLEGNQAKAELGYRAALAADPDCFPAHTGLGRIYNARGDSEKAIAEFKTVYRSSPNTHNKAEAAYSVGMLLAAGNDAALARGYLTQATVLDPAYPLGWYGLGTVLYMQSTATSSLPADQRGNLMLGSVTALNKAITLDPNQSIAYLQLGEDLYVIGEKDSALATLKKASAAVAGDITLSAPEKLDTLKRIAAVTTFITNAK